MGNTDLLEKASKDIRSAMDIMNELIKQTGNDKKDNKKDNKRRVLFDRINISIDTIIGKLHGLKETVSPGQQHMGTTKQLEILDNNFCALLDRISQIYNEDY